MDVPLLIKIVLCTLSSVIEADMNTLIMSAHFPKCGQSFVDSGYRYERKHLGPLFAKSSRATIVRKSIFQPVLMLCIFDQVDKPK